MTVLLNDFLQVWGDSFLGFAACGATLLAFAQKQMLHMRVFAIAANILFIGYGYLETIYPVLLLHLVLLPLNVARLTQFVEQRGHMKPAGPVLAKPTHAAGDPSDSGSHRLLGGGQWPAHARAMSFRSLAWNHAGPAAPPM